jgi:diguanylate cyclase (GGDEF)-like protein
MQLSLVTLAAMQSDILSGALGVLAAVILSFVAITLIASYYRFQHIIEQAEKVDPDNLGASAMEVLRVQLACYLASCARRGTMFSIALVRVDGSEAEIHVGSPIVSALKTATRHDDVACVYDDRTAALLLESEPEDGETILARILQHVAEVCPAVAPEQLRAGLASYPGHGLRGSDLVEVALEALEQAVPETPIILPEIIDAEAAEDDAEEDSGISEKVEASANHIPPELGNDAEDDGDDDEESSGWRDRRKSAMLDPLTGVLKPSAISPYMQRQMNELRYKKSKAAMFSIGINNMEQIERIHGEDAAEDVLVAISKVLQDNLRAGDLIGRHERYGFLVLAEASLEEAGLIGKRINSIINQTVVTSGGRKIKTTITLGVAAHPEHGRNLHQLYQAAQKVLDHSRANDIRAYAVYDPKIHDRMPSKPMKSIKSVRAD